MGVIVSIKCKEWNIPKAETLRCLSLEKIITNTKRLLILEQYIVGDALQFSHVKKKVENKLLRYINMLLAWVDSRPRGLARNTIYVLLHIRRVATKSLRRLLEIKTFKTYVNEKCTQNIISFPLSVSNIFISMITHDITAKRRIWNRKGY